MRRRIRNYRVLMSFSFGAAPREAILFLLCGAVMAAMPPVAALASKLIVDAALGHDLQRGLVAAGILAAAATLGLVNVLYYVDFLFTVVEKAGAAVDRRLMRLMAAIPGLEHHERPDYLNRLEALREDRRRLGWMTNATAGMLRVVVQLVATGILLARLNPILLLLPLTGFVSFYLGGKARTMELEAFERTTPKDRLRKHLFETATSVGAAKEIRVFGLERYLMQRHHEVASEIIAERDRAQWIGALLRVLDGLVIAAGYAGAVAFVWIRTAQGQGTPGDVVLTIGLTAGMTDIVSTAVGYGTHFMQVLRAADRYVWLEDYARDAQDTSAVGSPVPAAIREGIDLQGVSFAYPGTEREILRDVSLRLPAGSVVALVGENGAGKTTLVKLLSRMYVPTAGRISVDGIPLTDVPLHEWRARISTAFQDFMRFELLARESVGVGDLPRIDDLEVVSGAMARAGADAVVERLPHGLETQLGRSWDDGVDLSGGQWQKLALGRAMMRLAPLLLILDEPTASLDAQTEHQLFERYAEAAATWGRETGTITLLISHRFSTVRMADLILVMDGGSISEMGSHGELMERGGLYAELYELQARAYR
jgi:ATP-binding cassette subfamily B protein